MVEIVKIIMQQEEYFLTSQCVVLVIYLILAKEKKVWVLNYFISI